MVTPISAASLDKDESLLRVLRLLALGGNCISFVMCSFVVYAKIKPSVHERSNCAVCIAIGNSRGVGIAVLERMAKESAR